MRGASNFKCQQNSVLALILFNLRINHFTLRAGSKDFLYLLSTDAHTAPYAEDAAIYAHSSYV